MARRFTEEQLNNADPALLVQIILNLQDQSEALTKEVHELNEKMQLMMEQLILAKKNRFGRSTEKLEDPDQICFKEVDGNIVFFNESEAVCDLEAPEPEDLKKAEPVERKERANVPKIFPGSKSIRSNVISPMKNLPKSLEKRDGKNFRIPLYSTTALFLQK